MKYDYYLFFTVACLTIFVTIFKLGQWYGRFEIRQVQDRLNYYGTVADAIIPVEYDARYAGEVAEANCTFSEGSQYQYQLSSLLGYMR